MGNVLQPDNMLMSPYDPMGTYLMGASDALQMVGPLLLREKKCAAILLAANLSTRVLVYNLLANSALYSFYKLRPLYDVLQVVNRFAFWRLLWP